MSPLDMTPRFVCRGVRYARLIDATREAEFHHAAGHPCVVTALVTEPECYVAGEVVYQSKGAPQ